MASNFQWVSSSLLALCLVYMIGVDAPVSPSPMPQQPEASDQNAMKLKAAHVLQALKDGRDVEAANEYKIYTEMAYARYQKDPGYVREYISSLSTLGNLYIRVFLYTDAATAIDKAVAIARAWHPDSNRDSVRNMVLAEALSSAAILCEFMGQKGEAAAKWDEAMRLTATATDLPSAAFHARAMFQLALITQKMGDYGEALQRLLESEEAVRRYQTLLVANRALLGVGAEAPARAALRWLFDRWDIVYRRAEMHLNNGHPELARPFADELIRHRRQVLHDSPHNADSSAATILLLAQAEHLAGRVANAERRLGDATEMIESAYKRYHQLNVAEVVRSNISADSGCLAAQGGNFQLAEQRLRISVKLLEPLPKSSTRIQRITINTNIAILLSVQGNEQQMAAAIRLLEDSLDEFEQDQAANRLMIDRERRTSRATYDWTLGVYLSVGHQAKVAARQLYQRVLHWKASATSFNQISGLEFGADKANSAVGGAAWLGSVKSLKKQLAEAVVKQSYLLKKPADNPKSGQVWEAQLRDLKLLIDRTERQLLALGMLPAQDKLNPQGMIDSAVAAALPEATALIDFVEADSPRWSEPPNHAFNTERRMFAFVVTQSRPIELVRLPSPAAELNGAIRNWRQVVVSESSTEVEIRHTGDRLVREVWAPIVSAIPKEGVHNVIISPDRGLWQLPFAALPIGDDLKPYFIQHYGLSLAMSGYQVWAFSQSQVRVNTPQQALIVGNIEFGPDGIFSPVPTPKILTGFASTYGKTHAAIVSLTGPKVTRERVLDQLAEPNDDIVFCGHLAPGNRRAEKAEPIELSPLPGPTYDDSEEALYIPLAFSNRDPSERLLPEDIRNLIRRRLMTVGLIVCEGTRGKKSEGDGIVGFPRAFFMLGAQAVWTTLWPVNPDGAEEFSTRFFNAHWGNGVPLAEAFRKVQLSLLERTGDARRLPRYWAGWVVIGSPTQLPVPEMTESSHATQNNETKPTFPRDVVDAPTDGQNGTPSKNHDSRTTVFWVILLLLLIGGGVALLLYVRIRGRR